MLTTGAGAASKCHPLATATFADPTGDGSGANAPDITGVTVTSYEGGGTAFQIALANQSEFSSDMLVRIFIDSDKNASTGNDKGFEYMIQAQGTAPGTAPASRRRRNPGRRHEAPSSMPSSEDDNSAKTGRRRRS